MFNSLPHTINTCLESFRHNCQEYSRIILSNIIIYYPHIFQQTGWHSNIFPPRCMKKSTQLAVGKAQRQNIEYLAFTEWKWEIGPVWKPGRSSEKKLALLRPAGDISFPFRTGQPSFSVRSSRHLSASQQDSQHSKQPKHAKAPYSSPSSDRCDRPGSWLPGSDPASISVPYLEANQKVGASEWCQFRCLDSTLTSNYNNYIYIYKYLAHQEPTNL